MTTMIAPRTTPVGILYVAFELGWTEWKLAFATAPADRPRLRAIPARSREAVLREIAAAKKRFGLTEDAPVCSCYEAGRDGFWLHRWLATVGVDNRIVDSASIDVNRRARRSKTDRLDAGKLVAMLLRYHGGEPRVWSVVRVPAVADEDRRHLHRDLLELKVERTRHVNRIKGLLAGVGVAVRAVGADFPQVLDALRLWDGSPLPAELRRRLLREFERHQLVSCQARELENERLRHLRTGTEPCLEKVRKLVRLRGVGANSAWLYVMEFFGWRQIRNRRELAALAGLTPTPYQSGGSCREQGISKAGNRRLRMMAVEIAWCWLQYQPRSGLSQWYQQRFGAGNSRQRRIGIVALARKLLVALWQYLEGGAPPTGAEEKPWQEHLTGKHPRSASLEGVTPV
jgi:transposase